MKTILVEKKLAETIRRYLTIQPLSEEDCLSEDETISKTAVFEGGYEVDIKLCGVQYREGEDNRPWTEAVLFHNGSEICCTEPGDDFFGKWVLLSGGVVYEVEVTAE